MTMIPLASILPVRVKLGAHEQESANPRNLNAELLGQSIE
jgi:hypothetical protein